MNFRHQDEPDVGLPGHGRRRHESHLEPIRRRAHLRHETQVLDRFSTFSLFHTINKFHIYLTYGDIEFGFYIV